MVSSNTLKTALLVKEKLSLDDIIVIPAGNPPHKLGISLIDGKKRFGELKRSVGNVSQKVLTAALRELEANGLITRTVFAEVPPRVEYATTELGRSLKPVLDALRDWGERFQTQTATRRSLD